MVSIGSPTMRVARAMAMMVQLTATAAIKNRVLMGTGKYFLRDVSWIQNIFEPTSAFTYKRDVSELKGSSPRTSL